MNGGPDGLDWLDPWYSVGDEAIAVALQDQLAREIAPGHRLEGRRFRCIARRDDTDDALFLLDDNSVAEVHMTWRQSREVDRVWPQTAIFPSLETWAQQSMRPLHEHIKRMEQ